MFVSSCVTPTQRRQHQGDNSMKIEMPFPALMSSRQLPFLVCHSKPMSLLSLLCNCVANATPTCDSCQYSSTGLHYLSMEQESRIQDAQTKHWVSSRHIVRQLKPLLRPIPLCLRREAWCLSIHSSQSRTQLRVFRNCRIVDGLHRTEYSLVISLL